MISAVFLLAVSLSANVFGAAQTVCPADWVNKRQGDCWIRTGIFDGEGVVSAYVHPKGWIVDPRCFQDDRFTRKQLLEALDLVWRKMSPAAPLASGGCLSRYNPVWGKELVNAIWERRMHISCPRLDSSSRNMQCGATARCAEHEARSDGQNVLHLLAIDRCMGCPSALAGIIFHEALHAAGADNFSTEEHNRAVLNSSQMGFMRDRVYATMALCFLGPDPEFRRYVNPVMCRNAAAYLRSEPPAQDPCLDFDSFYTNALPNCFLTHCQ